MLIFGVDVPLVELVLVMSIIIFIILVESIIIMGLIFKQMKQTKELHNTFQEIMGKPKKS